MNRSKVLKNLIWRFAERIGAKLISVIVQLVLARLLAPEVYGTVAIVLVITNILQVFVESGFGTALIQKKNADDLDFSSVFWFNVVICIILYLLLYLFSPLIARIYSNDELIPIIRAVGLILIISGVRNVQQAYVSKNMLFKRFFFSTIGGTVIGGAVGIYMAFLGYGVWAYVAQYLLLNLISTIILWVTVKWRPNFKFSFSRLKNLFSYGWKLLAASLLNTVSDQLRPLIIGYKYSSSDLAFYNEGIIFPNLITENVNTSIDSVLLPALSEEQDKKDNIKHMTKRAVQVSSYVMWPLMVGIAVCAKPFVSLVLTDKWLPCVPFIRIFCFYYALWPIHTANLNAIKSIGRSDIFLKLEIIKKVIDFIVVIITLFISVKAMAVGLMIEGFLFQFLNAYPNSKLIEYRYFEQLKDIFPSMVISLLMGGVVFIVTLLELPDIATLLIQIVLGAAVYIALSLIFKIDTFNYILCAVKNRKSVKGE